jgi:hypothetical protein
MALAKVVRGKSLLIKVSDGGSPTPVYAHPCLINAARGIVFTAESNQTRIPDCDDPELISWIKREKTALGATINGAGVLNTPDTQEYFDWWKSASPKVIRIELNGVSGANGGGYFAGSFHLTNFEITGDIGEYAQCSLSLESDGEITWTDAS